MLNKSHQNISTKESYRFCLFSGIFLYALLSLPSIFYTLFPPTQPEGIHISYYVFQPPNIYAFILSFIISTIIGIYVLRKINFINRASHYLLLTLILSIISGLPTSILEMVYLSFIIDNYSITETWREFRFSIFYGGALLFLLINIPFTILFLILTGLIAKITKSNNRNNLR